VTQVPGETTLAREVFERYGADVRRYFRRMTGSVDEADDLAQEVFLRVVRAAPAYQPSERERAWLFRIARNVFLDDRRRSARRLVADADVEASAPPAQAVGAGVREAIATLPSDEREAFLLSEIGGLTYAEIAAAACTSTAAVRSRIYRARLALRARLEPPAPVMPGTFPRHDDE
jgi:RNA polymerase sigma-70 factor (ECF subfamily)